MLIKCEMYSITLELTVGMAQNMEAQNRMKDAVNNLQGQYNNMASIKGAVHAMLRRLEEGQDDGTCAPQQLGNQD